MSASIAVVGAAGLVGEALLEQLAEAGYSGNDVVVLDNEEAVGKRLEYGESWLKVELLKGFDFSAVTLAILALPAKEAAQLAPKIREAGALALDVSGVWLADPAVPVAQPGVLAVAGDDLREAGLVTLPGAAASLVARFLAPLMETLRPVSLELTVLYPAAMAGKAGIEELAGQTAKLLGSQQPDPGLFPGRLAFSLVSAGREALGSGPLAADASTEIALKRLFSASPMMIGCQSVVLPQFFGLAVGVVAHGHGQLDEASALAALESDGVEVVAVEQQDQAQNLLEGLEPVSVRVSNLRCQAGDGTRLQAWLSADMIRGCAARNCVQTVELLLKDYS